MKQLLILLFLLCSFAVLIVMNAEGTETDVLNLDTLIEEALTNNPEIKAFENRWNAFKERPSQAGSLEDPKLTLGISALPIDTFRFGDWDMTQKQISLSQQFPYPGKLKLRSEIAEHQADATGFEFEDKKIQTIRAVKDTYYQLFFIDRSTEITEKNKKLLEQLVKIAEVKYSVGNGLQQDVLLAQVELSKIIEDLITLKQKRKTSESRMNTLLYKDPRADLGKTADIEKTEFNHTLEELMTRAIKKRPLLESLKALIESADASYKLAKKEYYPDFNVGLSYGQREGGRTKLGMNVDRPDFVSGFVTVNIPLYFKTKQDKRVAQSIAEKSFSEERFNSLKNEIYFQLKDLMADEEKGNGLINLYKTGILPQAKQSLESSISGYQVDKVDFLTMLQNWVTLFKYENEYYKVLSDYEKTLASLEMIVGERLF